MSTNTAQPAQPAPSVEPVEPIATEHELDPVELLYGDSDAAVEPAQPAAPDDAPPVVPVPREDDEEIDPEDAAYAQAHLSAEITKRVETLGQSWLNDVARLAAETGGDPQAAIRAVYAGQAHQLLDLLESRAKAAAEQITDNGKKAVKQIEIRERLSAMRKTGATVGAGIAHMQRDAAEREARKVKRKRERELGKLPAGFDFKANIAWMRTQGYTQADINSVDSAKKALAIDAMRRGQAQQSGKPTPKRKLFIPKSAMRPGANSNGKVARLKLPTGAPPKRPETNRELLHRLNGTIDPVAVLYGKNDR